MVEEAGVDAEDADARLTDIARDMEVVAVDV
jgi:hypothetical protein